LQPFLIGLLAVIVYSFVVGGRGFWRIYKTDKKKYAAYLWANLIFFVLAPITVYFGYYAVDPQNPDVWLVTPLLVLAFAWGLIGFFVSAKAKRLDLPKPPLKYNKEQGKTRFCIGLSVCAAGILLWFYGFLFGIKVSEEWFVVLALFAVLEGGIMAFRHRPGIYKKAEAEALAQEEARKAAKALKAAKKKQVQNRSHKKQ
jgi:uncharacterized membrane protein YfcA